MITLQLEQKLTKEQIFEFTQPGRSNSVAASPSAAGEAAQVYFGKDLANPPRRGSLLPAHPAPLPTPTATPSGHAAPHIVLQLMRDNGYITDLQFIDSPTPINQAPAASNPMRSYCRPV